MNNLVKRGLTGTIYVLSVIAAIFIHPIVTFVYFLLISMIGLWEFCNVSSRKAVTVNKKAVLTIGFLAYACLFLQHERPNEYHATMIIAFTIIGLLLLFIDELWKKKESPFTNIAYSVLGVVYVVLPLALTNLIIDFNGSFTPMILMSVFIFAWCNDTFAYLTGMKFGKHKLFERISPKKTWEGWFGGFLFTIIAAVIVSYFSDAMPTLDFIVIAVITSVIGTLGDLVESMFKRQMGVKDSGNILPGHGGILDRFDILLLVLPAVYCYLLLRFQYI